MLSCLGLRVGGASCGWSHRVGGTSCGQSLVCKSPPGQGKVGGKVRIEFIVAGNHPSMAKSKI